MAIEKGDTLGHYRIVDKLGEGGMGVVWRAVDTTLDRGVAIKVLPPQLAAHPERLARFDREAKLLASLNHPNIAAVYGFDEHEGSRFVVMELVGGEDLSERVSRGPLSVRDALEIAVQIADALEAAHERGVIHRDLKPANVRLTPDGAAKVLDFGLAKSLAPDASGSGGDPSSSPTITTGGTAFGVVLGTAAYMSPEQARGKPVDRRTDMWAFGCVLFEMLTGRRAFDGETVTDTLSAVISREPEWSLLPARTPEATRRLLRRCLRKNVADRVRDAGDARLELLDAGDDAGDGAGVGDRAASGGDAAGRSPRRERMRLALAALAGAAVVGLGWMASSNDPLSPVGELPPLRKATFTGDVAAPRSGISRQVGFDVAADGRTAVYMTRDRSRAIVIDLDGGGSQDLFAGEPGTTLHDLVWSPDGGRAYLMTWPYSERVFSLPRLGGEPRRELDLRKLAGLNGISVRPLPGERWLVLGDHNTLYVGSDPASLEARGTQLHGEGVFRIEGLETLGGIAVSSDGRLVAFRGLDREGLGHAGVTDGAGSSEFVPEWSELEPVGWAEGGRALYLWRSSGLDVGDLMRAETDPQTGLPTNAPRVVYPRLSARTVRVSADGRRLVLCAGDRVVNLREFTLDGTPEAGDNPARVRTTGTGRWSIHEVLPDGTILASLEGDLGWELFAIADDGAQRSLLRLDDVSRRSVAISRDGKSIAIAIGDLEPAVMIRQLADNRSRTIPVPEPLSSVDWSPDGTHIVAMTTSSADRMVVVDLEREEARTVSLQCGERCEFAYEGVQSGPEWPFAAITSEVDTWIVNVETGELRHVATDTWNVIGWRDPYIYFVRGGGQTDSPGEVLFRVSAAGGDEERLLDVPPGCTGLEIDPAGRKIVCESDDSRLDLWLVDGLGE